MDYERNKKQMQNSEALEQPKKLSPITEINPDNLGDYKLEDLLSYVEHEAKASRFTGKLCNATKSGGTSLLDEDFFENITVLDSVPTAKKKLSKNTDQNSFLLLDKPALPQGNFLLKSKDDVNEGSEKHERSSLDLGILDSLENEVQMLVRDLDKKSNFKESKRPERDQKKSKMERREKLASNQQHKSLKLELASKLNSELEQTELEPKHMNPELKELAVKKNQKEKPATDGTVSKPSDSPSNALEKYNQKHASAELDKGYQYAIDFNEEQKLDKEVEETVRRYYGKDKTEVEKAKKALMDLKSGHSIEEENGGAESNQLSKYTASPEGSKLMRNSAMLESVSPMMMGGHVVRVNMLSSHLLGEFKVTKMTTFKELRHLVQAKTGVKNWRFQDLTTKRPLQNEDRRRVLAPNTHIAVAQVGLDILIADSAINGRQSMSLNRDGSCAFKVFWWDQKFHTSRQVWLKFEPHQISVTGIGGSFKLFDVKLMRVPLIFAGVKGSQLAFQFMKGKGNMASRFYALNLEQKKMIGIFFCFIWKPQAVKRGLIPFRSEITLDDIADEDDPRLFANVMRRHIGEIESIIRDIERTMDYRVVRRYIHLLSSVIGGAGSADDSSFQVALPTMNTLKDRYKQWNTKFKESQARQDPNGDVSKKEDSGFEFFENRELLPFEMQASSGDQSQARGATTAIDEVGNFPPAPPLPPPGQAVQKSSICAINFDGISTIDIPGTIWAEIDVLHFKPEEGKKLEAQLQIIFSRHSRERVFEDRKVAEDGILEINRLKNIEVLLFMEELKHYTIDEIVENILNFHESIFAPHVLERLVRLVNGSDGKVYSFLPSAKESELLLNYEKRLKEDDTLAPLRLGEKLFLEITKRVPDRVERFEYGYFLTKFEEENMTIKDELDIIRETEVIIRDNEKFKLALRILLEIVNTLMPRFGLTRGFKISTFCSSVERVMGSLSISKEDAEREMRKKNPKKYLEAEADHEVEELDEVAKKKALQLEKLRKCRTKKESDDVFWLVRLPEYMSVYLSKFEGCQGFWEELRVPCERAMKVDQMHLDQQSGHWIVQFDLIKEWSKNNKMDPNEPFTKRINDFIGKEIMLRELREEVLQVRKLTENLWCWMGERMESEPQLIFKYIHDFSENFHRQWESIHVAWNENRTLALRGSLPLQVCNKVSKPRRLSLLKAQKKTGSNHALQDQVTSIETVCESETTA